MDKTFDRVIAHLRRVFRDHDEFFIADPECALPACLIRPIAAADFEACDEIYKLNEAAHFPPGHFTEFQTVLRDGQTYFLVAEVAGMVRAFGGVVIYPHHVVEYAVLVFGMVHPDYRKQGFGTALLLARLATLPRPKKIWFIGITTTGGSDTFYGRFGFTFAGRRVSQKLKVELDNYYVKLPPAWQAECGKTLARESIKLESRGTDIPRVNVQAAAWSSADSTAVAMGPVYATWVVRSAGAVLGCFGLGLAALLIRVGADLMKGTKVPDFPSLAATGTLASLTLFCLAVGWRMVLMRPNSRGSVMGPIGWYVLGISFAALGIGTAVKDLVVGKFGGLVILLLTAPLALSCIFVARRISRRERQYGGKAAPDPPLTGGGGAVNRTVVTDIQDGDGVIEIFNDDATPMEFVVGALVDYVGLERPEAIQLMLEIHKGGSVIIPCNSEADATRIVALISARAREAGHPLRCEIAVPVGLVDEELTESK